MIDIGANVGAHALLAAHLVGPNGRVHAVEASPTIFRRLKRNVEANRATNIRIYNLAVSDKAGPVPVFLHDSSNLGGTTIIPSEAANRHCVQEDVVAGSPLDQIVPVADICAARLIKIDVEGAEWLVVKGMKKVLAMLRPDVEIIVEVTSRALAEFGVSAEQFLNIFTQHGFQAFEIPNRYSTEFYLGEPVFELVPARLIEFQRADIVFRKSMANPKREAKSTWALGIESSVL
jgi:FkbM family methyltransferase